ncbi:glutamine-synthetase adenylyltransferase [Flavimaricola marinus]|uniref:Glutamate-ammonia-ligase adenylyltransferase n=1 Tax=Flavimaricola marinus TaxID=1819565 RepID=A0A238LJV6_9RHOB|nr:glutamine-synthetase adenylyltransferase [Flavimaricola marinus]SMY09674.1 Glutamate-ammonia-ligase adenylyltransferase [Flavimaricola marinus]
MTKSLADRIRRTPIPYDPERGADALEALPWAKGPMADLIAGAAGCSPYLGGLMHQEASWLEQAVAEPEAASAALLVEITSLTPDRLASELRRAKRRMALITALADLGGVWSLEEVTGRLSDLADAACHQSLVTLVGAQIERGKLPGVTQDEGKAGGMVALAMGKGGAGELNYSSDIDLICLYDESQYDPADRDEARALFIKVTRRMTAILSENTAEGYVFRTDLRLRPDASVTPVCLSMAAAESYYESVGRTWERAAYIKARAAAGDIAAGEMFLAAMRPFVWRKHLDFAAIQDAHDMRLRIRDHKGLHGAVTLPGHNMKLGRGGIREIEFFTQTRQLIAGGRDPSLRVRGTVDGLDRLAQAGWVEPDTARILTDHYRAHREVEHRLQMIADAQTHELPASDDGFDRLAAFVGKDRGVFEAELRERLEEVHSLTEGFFAPDAAPTQGATVDFGAEVTARWPDYPALRSDRARELFRRLRPQILSLLQEAALPDEALNNFDGFLSGLPAGVQLFSLFDANPKLLGLIVDIAATAPALARYLSRNAGVLDAVIGGAFFAPWPGVAGLSDSLAAALGSVADYEARLDATRRWAKEWHFRIGVHHLRGLIGAEEAGEHYADLAQAVVAVLWPQVVAQFGVRHGPPPGRGAIVLAMGSLGAGRLNALSDLDLIVIYDGDGVEASDGPRPLSTRPYYAKLTQALVTALSAPTAEGKLYEVDMRLRPSGRQGPVATSYAAFQSYQKDEAWTWEHLALTRARPIAGEASLSEDVEAFRQTLLKEKSKGATVAREVADMRARIADAKPPQGDWDAKIGPGRLQDVELAAQMLALMAGSPARGTLAQIEAGQAAGLIDEAQSDGLRQSTHLFWTLQASARLLTGGVLVPEDLGEGGSRFVLRETLQPSTEALLSAMKAVSQRAADVIDSLLPETGDAP